MRANGVRCCSTFGAPEWSVTTTTNGQDIYALWFITLKAGRERLREHIRYTNNNNNNMPWYLFFSVRF